MGGDRTSELQKVIDKKVTEIISECYEIALNLIQYNRCFYSLANKIMKERVLDKNDFNDIELDIINICIYDIF